MYIYICIYIYIYMYIFMEYADIYMFKYNAEHTQHTHICMKEDMEEEVVMLLSKVNASGEWASQETVSAISVDEDALTQFVDSLEEGLGEEEHSFLLTVCA